MHTAKLYKGKPVVRRGRKARGLAGMRDGSAASVDQGTIGAEVPQMSPQLLIARWRRLSAAVLAVAALALTLFFSHPAFASQDDGSSWGSDTETASIYWSGEDNQYTTPARSSWS
jgi:hypothetical protein